MKKYLILLALSIAWIASCFGQGVYELPQREGLYSCDKTKVDFPPQTSEDILTHVMNCVDLAHDVLVNQEFTLVSGEIISNETIDDHGCTYEFTRFYLLHVLIPPDETYPEGLASLRIVRERFVVEVRNPYNYYNPSLYTYETDGGIGYYPEDMPPEKTKEEWGEIYPDIRSSCGDFNGMEMIFAVSDDVEEDDCTVVYTRNYVFKDKCVPEDENNSLIAIVQERVSMTTELKVNGKLRPVTLIQNQAPPEYNSLEDLRKAGVRVRYSRPPSDLVVWSEEVTPDFPNRRKVKVHVVSISCDDMEEILFQDCLQKIVEPVPFKVFFTESTMDGIDDGTIEVYLPPMDEGCTQYPGNTSMWYNIVVKNLKTEEEIDISETLKAEDLARGEYQISVFATCPECNLWGADTVFTEKVKIDSRKMDVKVTDGYSLWNGNYYSTYHLQLDVERDDGSYVPFEEYDAFVGRFNDEWKLMTGKIYSPRSGKQFDAFEMFNIHMNGLGMYEHIMFHYHLVNDEFSHGLQRMIIAKNEKRRATYTLRKPNGEVFMYPVYKDVYGEQLICAVDPNEIYGPAGYTAEDSTVVRMINATDNVNYTIQFENDPEFATAAAARVKIVCPLDEHADPTSFRLGNFGFGSHTFEVPPMTNYYNKRINMDTLGYWLDVTAVLEMPQKNATWIFQTIDPATGMSPIDSLGFLPVNDTLTGEGEGFVTFSVTPIGGINRTQVMTGDTIVEQAEIYFDENDVIPTNRYKNYFDAVAPTSTIVCDTTGAVNSRILNLGFQTSDDPGGSGIDYVELYVNIDHAGYEKVGVLEPDSIFVYSMIQGSNFGFMCLAVDNVGNREGFKSYDELTVNLGTAPSDLTLSNNVFAENDELGTPIGVFETFDDQNTDNFVYALVAGEGGDDNNLFALEGNILKTNHDFRCYGTYEFHIRVRTTDVTDASLEKSFTVYAQETEAIPVANTYIYLCPGDEIMIGGQVVSTEGYYYDTLSSYLGCDSVVCRIVSNSPTPVTQEFSDGVCYGSDYSDNGFEISADSIALLTTGWNMEEPVVLSMERYDENGFGCYDTTRLTLTVNPGFEEITDVRVCELDLPYMYKGWPFYNDTIVERTYTNANGCDSVFALYLTVNPEMNQANEFTEGWNWFSTYIDQSNGQGLANLENALDGHAEMIKSKTQFVMFTPSTNLWFGSLEEINNTSMFMIKMNDAYNTSVSGCSAEADTILLNPGWTWIGYPLTDTLGVNQLTQGIGGAPSNNDVIKSKQSFAMYYADYGIWLGLLSDLMPGMGYMYMSNSSDPKPLNYNNCSRTDDVHLQEAATPHWVANDKQYAYNMTMLGIIWLDKRMVESDSLEVGAFVNGEERGAGRAVYIEEMDAYRIFLTVHGEEGDVVNFRLFDHSRDKERRIRCQENITFHPDSHYGTLDNPYKFVFLTDYDKYIQAEICEGEYYTENNFRVFKEGTYFQELTTAIGNDSIVRLDLTVNPVYRVEETVVATGFPFEYEGVVFDKPGTHVLPFKTAAACDSVWVVTMRPYEGERELLFSPQPASRSQRVNVYFPFTQQEQQGVEVEIYTFAGSLIQAKKPTRFPIELDPFTTAGTYMVKITMGTGEVITGKLIIK